MSIIELPVSFGEALDKLTILEIKLEKIQDDRRKDVKVEYDMLYERLASFFTSDVLYHYTILKAINLSIWEMQDILRTIDDETEKIRLTIVVLDDNDRRFRVKAKLNTLMSSVLREQKGYARRKVAFICPSGSLTSLCAPIRYLSTVYENVTVYVEDVDDYAAGPKLFGDDSTILFSNGSINPSDFSKVYDCSIDIGKIYVDLKMDEEALRSKYHYLRPMDI